MDIENELNKALQDPDIMKKVGSVLSSLGKNQSDEGENTEEKQNTGGENALLKALQGGINDNRANLLVALKPFLSEKRAPYMDSALTILKMAKMGKIGKDLKLF